jgi:hypothetical protein
LLRQLPTTLRKAASYRICKDRESDRSICQKTDLGKSSFLALGTHRKGPKWSRTDWSRTLNDFSKEISDEKQEFQIIQKNPNRKRAYLVIRRKKKNDKLRLVSYEPPRLEFCGGGTYIKPKDSFRVVNSAATECHNIFRPQLSRGPRT